MIKASELRKREVVNVHDGKRLGFVSDLELDSTEGNINAMIIPGPGRLFGILGGERDYVIPWHNIVKIGSDVILVELPGTRPSKRYYNKTNKPYSND